jgi:hypothetical protein
VSTWRMYAHDYNGRLGTVGNLHYVKAHGLPQPIVPVEVAESEDGKFLGWIATGDGTPRMIQPDRLFEMQFPYGSRAEEERGKGRVVRLSVSQAVCTCITDHNGLAPKRVRHRDGCPKHDKEKP